jgi:hypothetical protein
MFCQGNKKEVIYEIRFNAIVDSRRRNLYALRSNIRQTSLILQDSFPDGTMLNQ